MATMIAKGKTGLFYATDPTHGGMLVAARSIEEAYSRVVSAVILLDSGGNGPPLDGHDILATDDGTLITVPHSSWQTRPQVQETRSLLVRLLRALPSLGHTSTMALSG